MVVSKGGYATVFLLSKREMTSVHPQAVNKSEPKVRSSPRFGFHSTIYGETKKQALSIHASTISFPSIIVYTPFSKAIILLQKTEL